MSTEAISVLVESIKCALEAHALQCEENPEEAVTTSLDTEELSLVNNGGVIGALKVLYPDTVEVPNTFVDDDSIVLVYYPQDDRTTYFVVSDPAATEYSDTQYLAIVVTSITTRHFTTLFVTLELNNV